MTGKLTITLNEQPINLDEINAKFLFNGEPFEYTEGQDKINKIFVEDVVENRIRYANTTKAGTLLSALGEFDGIVHVIKIIDNMWVIGGEFENYTKGGITYNCNGIIFLDIASNPIDNPENTAETFNEVFKPTAAGIVYDITERTLNGNLLIEIVGEFERFNALSPTGSEETYYVGGYFSLDATNLLTQSTFLSEWINTGQTGFSTQPVFSVDVEPNSNRVIFGGDFNTLHSVTVSSIAIINSNYTINTTFNANFQCDGVVHCVKVKPNTNFIFVGGERITTANVVILVPGTTVTITLPLFNFFKVNTTGQPDFDYTPEIVGRINDINILGSSVYIGGLFSVNIVGGAISNLAKYNTNAPSLDTTFVTPLLEVNDIEIMPIDFNLPTTNQERLIISTEEYGFTLGLDGTAYNQMAFTTNTKVKTSFFFPANESIFWGGDFTVFNNSEVVNPNLVSIGADVAATTLNLFNNLVAENSIPSVDYATTLTATDEIEITFNYFDDDILQIIDILNAPAVGTFRVELTTENVTESLIDIVKPILVRSDNVFTSSEGSVFDWNNVDFKLTQYTGNINDFNLQTLDVSVINKLRLATSQNNQYLDTSTLVTCSDKKVDDFYREVSSNIYQNANLGKFLFLRSNNKVGDIVSDTKINFGLILDGFREDRRQLTELPVILLNGNSRRLIKEFRVPFIQRGIKEVRLLSDNVVTINQNIDNITKLSEDTTTGVILYAVVERSSLGANARKATLQLIDNNDRIAGEVFFDVEEENCNFDHYDMTFINRFGVFERFEINGSVFESDKVKMESYSSNIRDINGSYDYTDHTEKSFDKDGTKTVEINTGIIKQYNNKSLSDLVMSKQVWLVNRSVDELYFNPVKVKDTNFNYKTSYRDSLIDYNFKMVEDNSINKNI